jgi:hypothetical protein
MKNLKAIAIVWSVLAVVASAAAVWDTKPFMEWSDKDMEKLLTDSPWAGKASLTHEREGANLGPVPDWHLIVSVRSAEPIRRAVARQLLAAGLPASPALEANLAAPYPRYAIAFAKIPQFYRTQLQKSAQGTVLRVKGQNLSPIGGAVQLLDKDGKEVQPPPARGPQPRPQASAGVQIVPVAQGGGGFGGGGFGGGGFGGGKDDGTTATMVLEFPKAEGVTAADGDVEVATIVGGYKIKKIFKLKEMMFKGALAF